MQRESVEKQSIRSASVSRPGNARPESIAQLHPLLKLQRSAGNRAVQRMLAQGVAQGKVQAESDGESVSQVSDGVDGRVRSTAVPIPSTVSKGTSAAPLQRSPSATDSASTQESSQQEQNTQVSNGASLASPRPPDESAGRGSNGEQGNRLDSSIRSVMGARFAHDFSGVRIHTDAPSAMMADKLDAHAVTMGSDIYFERGGYAPETQQGRSVLAHELTHVVQNQRGASGVGASEASLEAEADVAGVRAMAGQAAHVRLGSQAPVLKLSRGAKTALGVGLGAVAGGIVGVIGLGIAQALGATIAGDTANKVLLGAAGVGALVGGAIGLFSKEKEQELPPEETETADEAAQDFHTRLLRWLDRGLEKLHGSTCQFPSGDWRYDERYWEPVTQGEHFRTYQPKDIAPALAVDRLFQNLDLWDFDCAIYPEVAMVYAYRHALGTNDFNTKFKDLRIRQHGTTGLPWESHSVEQEGEPAFSQLWDESPVGTKITWTNRSTAANGTDWKNENGIKRLKGLTPDQDRFDAFPLGARMLEKDVKMGLAENASDFPRSGDQAEKQAYVDANIYRHQLQLLKDS